MQQWQQLSEKFQTVTPREQFLIFATGVIAIVFILFNFVIEPNSQNIDKLNSEKASLTTTIKSKKASIVILEQALNNDPNETIRQQIALHQQRMGQVDANLMLLASDLINPIQMRGALIELLDASAKVNLVEFEMFAPQIIELGEQKNTDDKAKSTEQETLTLYKHGMKLTLSGGYFSLRDYLSQLEQMKWTFFWQTFDYEIKHYPKGELEITLYSLSTRKEFMGV